MRIKALFLDFYGTLVHEDDHVIPIICEQIIKNTNSCCSTDEIKDYWCNAFYNMLRESFGERFELQKTIGIKSLSTTVSHFNATCNAEEIIKVQFDYLKKPLIFEDTRSFIEEINIPIYILSNVDNNEILQAINHLDIHFDDILTSEDVQSYKPRTKIFEYALKRYGLRHNEVIHIGDSVENDIRPANHMGIKSVLINRYDKKIPNEVKPDFVLGNLRDLISIL